MHCYLGVQHDLAEHLALLHVRKDCPSLYRFVSVWRIRHSAPMSKRGYRPMQAGTPYKIHYSPNLVFALAHRAFAANKKARTWRSGPERKCGNS